MPSHESTTQLLVQRPDSRDAHHDRPLGQRCHDARPLLTRSATLALTRTFTLARTLTLARTFTLAGIFAFAGATALTAGCGGQREAVNPGDANADQADETSAAGFPLYEHVGDRGAARDYAREERAEALEAAQEAHDTDDEATSAAADGDANTAADDNADGTDAAPPVDEAIGTAGRHEHAGAHAAHEHHSGHMEQRFTDPERHARSWNDPARDRWQRPDRIVRAMEIERGMTVVDLGTGTGYLIPYLARAVGPEGRVFAVDIEQAMLDWVDRMAQEQGLTNVTTVLASSARTNLPEQVDRIVTINTWHHIPDRVAYSARLRERLRPGGSLWVVDYRPDAPEGPPANHRIPASTVLEELRAAGFEAERHPLQLDRQHVVVGR